ncbi:hypothetical protein SCANT_v1c04450 [Spiroplasma cantharicola]|uniref:Uncharacterized protein n=1 Tax=Spiroplasma cantharicola TaxID=362837 RepID=A0A0M5KGX7_9MOLU|nr:hypothetical protein SCANT_v1c04450 [Spiroplasma cantharicola]
MLIFFIDQFHTRYNIGYTEGLKSDLKSKNELDFSADDSTIGLGEYISICSLFNYFHTTKKLKYFTDQ